MKKNNSFRCIFLLLSAFVLITFSFKDHVYSKSESNHDDRGYESIAIDTTSDRIFAAKEDEKSIDVIDIKTGSVLNSILSGKEPKTIAIDEQRKTLVVADEEDETISIISLDTLELLSSIPLKEEPESISIDSESGILLITAEDNKVTAIDLNTNQKIKEIKIPQKPVSIAIDPQLHIAVIVHNTWGKGNKDGERGESGKKGEEGEEDNYSKNKDRDNITIIALPTLTITKTLQAGKNPTAVAINPLTHEAAITNEKSNDITLIDLNALKNEIATSRLVGTRNDNIKGIIPTGKHPEALSYNQCLNTLSVVGGEDKAWMYVIDMDTWNQKTSYTFKDDPKDIKIHPYLNKAVITGEQGLNLISLPNPIPQLTSITPEKALRGGKTFTLALNGKGLLRTTEIFLNGNKANTTFLGCGSIEVDIPGQYLKHTGDIEIKAINPTPQGGASNPLYLKIENPVPQISTIDPLETKTNIQNLVLTIYGTGFFEDTEIYFANIKKPISYISPTKLQINLTHEDLKTAGQYEITARNLSPGGGYSNKAILTIKPSLEITITSPQNNTTINKARTIVKGTFKSDTKDVGIKVNGIIAEITGNQWIANNIPLAIGANSITATIKDSEGNTETASITINTTDTTQNVTLSANITSGIAPLQVYFSTSTETPNPITNYQMDYEGDGIIDYTGATFENITHTYTTEGIFYPTLTVTDKQGNIYSDTIAITVMNKTEIDTLLKGKWEGMKGALAEGNIEAALAYFHEQYRDELREAFTFMQDKIAINLSLPDELNFIAVYDKFANYENVVYEPNGIYSYPVLFIKDENGIWKIRSF